MCTINLSEVMNGKNYPDAGDSLYELINKEADRCDRLVLNMEGVDAMPSMFLNTSIGRIIQERGAEFLRQKVLFARITRSQAERLKSYIDRYVIA